MQLLVAYFFNVSKGASPSFVLHSNHTGNESQTFQIDPRRELGTGGVGVPGMALLRHRLCLMSEPSHFCSKMPASLLRWNEATP